MAKAQRGSAPEEEGLGTFEGLPVDGIQIALTGIGDGLSKAMKVAPSTMQVGEIGYAVVKFRVQKIRHDENEKDEETGKPSSVNRVQMLRALGATVVSYEVGGEMVDSMIQRVADFEDKEKALKKGQFRLPLGIIEGGAGESAEPTEEEETGDGAEPDDPAGA